MDPLLILLILLILFGAGGTAYVGPVHGVLPALVLVLVIILVVRLSRGERL